MERIKITIDEQTANRIVKEITDEMFSSKKKDDEIVKEVIGNRIKQYRPAFFTGFENEVVEFDTTEELLEIEFVKRFRHSNFNRYSLSDNKLMAEYEDGYEWWVVGTIDKPQEVNLPKWKPKYK